MDKMTASSEAAATAPGLSVTLTWDYREQPPMENIAQRVRELSGGTVTMAMPETGSDQYELVITRQPQAAPELAEAMAETRKYREVLTQVRALAADWADTHHDGNERIQVRAVTAQAILSVIERGGLA